MVIKTITLFICAGKCVVAEPGAGTERESARPWVGQTDARRKREDVLHHDFSSYQASSFRIRFRITIFFMRRNTVGENIAARSSPPVAPRKHVATHEIVATERLTHTDVLCR